MNPQPDLLSETARLLALAERLQDEGQVNLNKLLEAAVYGRLHREAWKFRPLITTATMQAELRSALNTLKQDGLNPSLITALETGHGMMADRQIPLIEDAPDVFVCRVCGHAALGAVPDHCPDCGAWPGHARKFVGTFNGDNYEPVNPIEILALLASNAQALETLVEGLSQEEMNRKPAEAVWAIHNHVAHFHGAHETLETRVQLMLTQKNPELMVLALYDLASQAPPLSTTALLADFLDNRKRFVVRLEALPLQDFWRTGWHQEFGQITVIRQMAYMANHEQTHLPEIEALRKAIIGRR